jgi:predicted small lipoprotein YifL
VDRRQFSLLALAAGLATGVSACGRRGALEPPPYTAQGQEWAKRQGRNPDGTPKQPGQANQPRQGQQAARQPTQGSVSEGLQRDEDQRGTVDVEANIERNRPEGAPRVPSDPITTEPGQSTPTISPTGGRRRPPGIVPPKQPFILDGLLE